MITSIQIKNFKSWADSTTLELAPLTGFFGTNSSGKTSILQALLLLKQTIESPDRKRVLNTGDDRTPVDLGTFYDLIHSHDSNKPLEIKLSWNPPEPVEIHDPEKKAEILYRIASLAFQTTIKESSGRPITESFSYSFDDKKFGMSQYVGGKEYRLISDNFNAKRVPGRAWPLPDPVKCYGFPDEAIGYYQNLGFLPRLVLIFEEQFGKMAYLGPLREYPKRSYLWAGDDPGGIGRKGEFAIPVLLAKRNKTALSLGKGIKRPTIEERIAYWLREMGLIDSFELEPISKNRKDYELKVRTSSSSPLVSITDVGFGVSQILPVLVLSYYVPEKSTILLEQPEIHLHPSVQAALADFFVEVVTKRNVQIILESHSEHLLRRLQRRIAENKISTDKTSLFFCQMGNSQSIINKLEVDQFGNIQNWPDKFFGDEIGDLNAMIQATNNRQSSKSNS